MAERSKPEEVLEGKSSEAEPVTMGTATLFGLERRTILGTAAIILLTFASYIPALRAGFVWDDTIFTEDRAIAEWSDIWRIWFSPAHVEGEGHYWPILYSTLWIDHKLWGFDPVGYHAVNVLLHLANSLMLWCVATKLRIRGAWLIAAVFAVHPVHAEPVTWVIGRKDLLSAFLSIAAVLSWLRFEETEQRRSYLEALALFTAALLSKSTAATLPVALLILAWYKRGRITVSDWKRTAPFFAVSVALTLADFLFYRSREAIQTDFTIIERIFIASRAIWSYVGKALWPDNLAVIYPHWDVSPANPIGWLFAIAAGGTGVALWRFIHRIGRGPLAGAAFFLVTLTPVVGLIDYGFLSFSFFADRYQYLASFGVIAVVVSAAVHAKDKLPLQLTAVAVVIASSVLVVFGALTWQHASNYQDSETFFTYVVSANPDAISAYTNLSVAYLEQERYEDALEAALSGLDRYDPDNRANADPHASLNNNAGIALASLGRTEQAEQQFRNALRVEPGHEKALENLVKLLEANGRYAEAAVLLQNSGEATADTLSNAGLEQQEQGDHDAAELSYRQALEIEPDHYPSLVNLAGVLKGKGLYDDAAVLYRAAMEADPDGFEAPLGMAQLEVDRDDYGSAEEFYQRAHQIDPTQSAALAGLGALRNTRGDYEGALELLERALAITTEDADVYAARGVALFYLGSVDEAIADLERAIALDPVMQQPRDNLEAILQSLDQPSSTTAG
ncbi:MAG: tetratricopeptide repeat protein [Acidimicrobiaceae bacterium]|nr:tetratricopeptide repeat protein [Acidimicrobiaceae bacterium]MXW74491.1 tetratricopeptide repeat protein [Acidimicrobiaceae bacterium]MYD05484.1 tetratricopeptide repeat protein [Acidimicrobiaceae bacterium]MYI57118.1 tetratricopeptide repeat protein [Acidimicrobiaceae bacterium]